MRFSVAIIACAVASASASTLFARQQFPDCAGTCLTGDAAAASDCKPTDQVCLCKDEKFIAASTACITEKCADNPADIEAASKAAKALCAALGVTLTGSTPPATSTSPGSSTKPPASSSTTPPPAGSSTLPPGSSTHSASTTGKSTTPAPASSSKPPSPSPTGNSAGAAAANGFAGLAAVAIAALAL